jgi:hypothetical protein
MLSWAISCEFARRDVAQRERLSDHRQRARIERMDILDHLTMQAALEQGRGERRGADLLELVARLRTELAHRRPPQ